MIDEDGNDINSKYELQPQIFGPQDPRQDGMLLGLGLAKTGTTSLYTTFCTYSLLNSNCRVDKPEDKYWHKCIWNHFQPIHTDNAFEYDINNILDIIDDKTYPDHCSIEGWAYFSFVYTNPFEPMYQKRRRKPDFFNWNKTNNGPKYINTFNEYKNNISMTPNERFTYFVRGYHVKTTNHFGSIYIPYILHYAMVQRGMKLKFYVMFRNPMSRILSSYIFMVGYEKKYISNRFANISTFIRNDINNENLINILNILNNKQISIWNLDWKYIFKQWILYEANTRKQCYDDRKYLTSISNQISADLKAERDKIPKYQRSVKRPPSVHDEWNEELSPREKILELRNMIRNKPKRKLLTDSLDQPRRIDLRQKRKETLHTVMMQRDKIKHIRDQMRKNGDNREDKDRVLDELRKEAVNKRIRRDIPHSEMRIYKKQREITAKIAFTCERDVFRSSVGDTCYIIPLMFWIHVFGKDLMNEKLRIFQTELLVTKMDEYVAELLCFWAPYTCGLPLSEIQNRRIQRRERGTGRIRKDRRRRRRKREPGMIRQATTFRYQDNEKFPEFIVNQDVLNEFNAFFKPCNRRLIELLTLDMPELMLLDEFDINQWDFNDN